jgi:hypothetical protein
MELIQLLTFITIDLMGLFKTFITGVKFSAGTKGNVQVIQILFQTPSAVAFRNVSGNAVGSIDSIGSHLFELEWKVSKYLTGQDAKRDRILPNSKLFKSSIEIFSFHDWFVSWIVIFFSKVGKKPNIPSFHHSIIPIVSEAN